MPLCRHWSRIALVLAVVFCAGAFRAEAASPGVVSHVLVLSDKCEDVSSLEAWKKTYIRDRMSDQEKALAIWKTVVKYRHQDPPPQEGLGEGCVHDPLKTIHVYGYGMCCCAASDVEGLARYLGLDARGWAIHLHSVPEVFYGGSWHLLDGSLMNYFLKPDGQIAGVEEIHRAIRQWYAADPARKPLAGNDSALRKFSKDEGWKRGPELLASCKYYDRDGINAAGWHGWWSNMQEYNYKEQSKSEGYVYEYGPSLGYELNVQLRAGERITRNWSNRGLHINSRPPQGGFAQLMKGDRRALGLQRELGDRAPGRIGNGTREYNLPLADGGFRAGMLTVENLASTADDRAAPAVHVKDATRPGMLVFRMPSSYVYLTGQLTAEPVVGAGGRIVVSLSDNQGLDWREIATLSASGQQTIDITKQVFDRYDYRLRLEFHGAGTGLDALGVVHDFQHSQAPLPTLLAGDNQITFRAGPDEGTITYEPMMAGPKPDGRVPHLMAFHPQLDHMQANLPRPDDSGRGSATLQIATPGDMTRLRMNLHYRCRDQNGKDAWDVEASLDGGRAWQPLAHLDRGRPDGTRYIVFDRVPAGVREALVRLRAVQRNTTALLGFRLDADYREPAGGFLPVKITYTWDEAGQAKTDVHVARTPQETYAIHCGPGTVVKSFTLEPAE